MRHLGTLPDEHQAQTFVDYVLVRGVKATVEREHSTEGDTSLDKWAVWVYDEDSLPTAREEFAKFLQNPNDATYAEVARQAAAVRADEQKKIAAARKKIVNVRDRWRDRGSSQLPATILCIGLCIALSVMTDFGKRVDPIVSTLTFSRVYDMGNGDWGIRRGQSAFRDILNGQVWRVVTPVLLHANWMHLLFNMYWTAILGSMIERRRGSWRMLLYVLAFAAFSNTVQAVLSGPLFLGFSGVTHGLFGYVWMQSVYVPDSGFYLHRTTVAIFLIWFVFCFFPAAGPIANGAHWGGLVLGMLFGYAPKLWRDMKRAGRQGP